MPNSRRSGEHPHTRMARERRRSKLRRWLFIALYTLLVVAVSIGLALSFGA